MSTDQSRWSKPVVSVSMNGFSLLKDEWDDTRYSGAYHQKWHSVQWRVSVWGRSECSLFSSVRQLLLIQAEDMMHKLVLLTRLDHPTSYKDTIQTQINTDLFF